MSIGSGAHLTSREPSACLPAHDINKKQISDIRVAFYQYTHIIILPRRPSGLERDCYARGLGFDSRVEQKVLLGFSMKFSVSSSESGFVPG